MLTLAIETSSPHGSIALLDGEQLLARQSHDEPNAHAERMLTLVDAAFEHARVNKRALQRIAVGIGPGSFTGLRVGLALAQGLALGLGVPLVGVSSLAILAHGAKRSWQADASPNGTALAPWFVPVLDARRGELFFAAYDTDDQERIAPTRAPVADAGRHISGLCGDRPLRWCGAAARLMQVEASGPTVPSAEDAGWLAQRLQPTPEVHLQYLRDADAKLPSLPPNPLPKS